MAYLNVNVPPTSAQIRREYLYDLKKHHGEVEDCIIFGLTSLGGRAILWHALMENGAIFYRLPLNAFIQRGFKVEDVPAIRLDELGSAVWRLAQEPVTIEEGIFVFETAFPEANKQELSEQVTAVFDHL